MCPHANVSTHNRARVAYRSCSAGVIRRRGLSSELCSMLADEECRCDILVAHILCSTQSFSEGMNAGSASENMCES